MVRFQSFKIASISFFSVAMVAASPASAAGSCGGFYAVDAPTTLTHVAKACRVSVASLREANPGVNPGNVRPGEHLAVPVGIAHANAPTALAVNADAFNKLQVSIPFTEDLGFRARTAQRVRLLAAGAVPGTPAWMEPGAAEGGHFSSSAPLSFQKVAALRIETASVQTAQMPIFVSSSVPAAQFTNKSGVSQGYRLPDYSQIGVAPPVLITPAQAVSSLTGIIDNAYNGCFTLQTADGQLWRLAAAPISNDMIGETITVWGAASNNNVCGAGASMNVSHAVFAEPWIED